MNCFRYLGVGSYHDALSMSLPEYLIRMEAYALRQEDEMRKIYHQAWIEQRVVTATDKKGQYVFKNFNELYVKVKPNRKRVNPELYEIARRLQQLRKGGGN